MSLLLEAGWAQQASDFITAKWAELLGILGGTAGITVILGFIAKLILTFVKAKIDKKATTPIFSKFAELENQFVQLKETFFAEARKIFSEEINAYLDTIEAKIDSKIAEYQARKQEICNAIVQGKQDVEQLIKEGEQIASEVKVFVDETKEEIETAIEEQKEEIQEAENVSRETLETTPQKTKIKKTYGKTNPV